MMTVSPPPTTSSDLTAAAQPAAVGNLAEAAEFLTTLFLPSDQVLLRPIETWVDRGKKRSRVVNGHVTYIEANGNLDALLMLAARRSEAERANVFCGVCPRVGGKQEYDQAWQIRTVRCLWADVDDCTADEIPPRVESAGLPTPSVLVASGNGAHVYWLLDSEYHIDDCGPPVAVLREFVKQPDGKSKPRKYIQDESGEKLYLDV